jgi:hypothetical protein
VALGHGDDGEALLHRGVDVGRDATAGLQPHLDVEDGRAVGIGALLEGEAVPEDGIDDDVRHAADLT